VAGRNTERDRKTHLINRWLRDCCCWWNFGFFDRGKVYTALGLLVTDAVQLSQRGKRILAHELEGFIERARFEGGRGYNLVERVPWDRVLKGKGVQEGWTFFKEEILKVQEQAVPMCRKTNRWGR